MQIKTTTVRLPPDLDQQLARYATHEELSKNQVIKKALRELFEKKSE